MILSDIFERWNYGPRPRKPGDSNKVKQGTSATKASRDAKRIRQMHRRSDIAHGDAVYNKSGSGKKRPNKDLWYADDRYWRNDLEMRLPGLHFVGDEENEEVFALDQNEEDCYGVWRYKEHRGVTFNEPRPIGITSKPKCCLKDYMPEG